MFRILIVLTTGLSAISIQAAPVIQHWQTDNGARVYFVPAPELPMVDIRIVFDAASARDGDKPGVAAMTAGLLEEGAGKLNADQIADRFDSIGADFGTASLRDMSLVSLRSLTDARYLQPALETMTLILTQPSFPQNAFDRERKRALIGLQAKKQSPEAIADEAFFNALYGDHPYAHDPSGTEQSLKKLTRNDLIKHHKRYYVGSNAIITITGAVDRAQAEKIAQQLIGKLPTGEPAPALPPVKMGAQAVRVTKNFPSTQTHLLVGQAAITRDDPDYFPLYVGNHILGGSGLVSRLSDEIREKRGLSYNTYSYFSPMREAGPFQMGLQTRTDQATQALELLQQTLQTFMNDGPTAEELREAKQNITGGFALRLDSNKKIIENIAAIGFYNQPLDYLDTFNAKIEAVTAEQIKDAFKRRIHPDKMLTVIVGAQANADAAAP
ncbi:MAG: insulinase family protein [Gammaproteobacteria bacterium]|nr:insulinase family protein [Gammaproteobacteria bacterium]